MRRGRLREARVKGLYEGMVRGLKRVLLEEVARRATEEYYEAQRKTRETEAHEGGDAGETEGKEAEERRASGEETKGRMSTHSRAEQRAARRVRRRAGKARGASGKGVTRDGRERGRADDRGTATKGTAVERRRSRAEGRMKGSSKGRAAGRNRGKGNTEETKKGRATRKPQEGRGHEHGRARERKKKWQQQGACGEE